MISKCQTCGNDFRVYPSTITRKHCSDGCRQEAPLKGIKKKCLVCGKEIYIIPAKEGTAKYCSRKCWYEFKKTGAKKKCPVCGKEFYVARRRDQKGHGEYCSKECRGKSRQKRIARKCSCCGKDFYVAPSRYKVYCSKKCWIAKFYQNNPKRICLICGKEFYAKPSCVKKGKVKCCSRVCQGKLRRIVWANYSEKEKEDFIKKTKNFSRPNKKEEMLNMVLLDLFPGEYKYVGNREFILAGKNPDFLNVNGQKKIIELYGDYWHKGDDPQERIDLFGQYGYDTLVVWEKELKNLGLLKNKLLSFNAGA